MALLHQAELRPTKLELLATWLPGQPWYQGAGEDLARVGAYRFDDPAGEVGVETLLVQAPGGPLVQVPLTYRGAPLAGAEEWLVGTMDHSVLGPRWIYDACGDPVYATVLANAILAGYSQAEEFIEVDGELQRREPSARVGAAASLAEPRTVTAIRAVTGGDPTVISTETVELGVVRVLNRPPTLPGAVLTGTWDGRAEPFPLAYAVVA